jgi:hypothetical protein
VGGGFRDAFRGEPDTLIHFFVGTRYSGTAPSRAQQATRPIIDTAGKHSKDLVLKVRPLRKEALELNLLRLFEAHGIQQENNFT